MSDKRLEYLELRLLENLKFYSATSCLLIAFSGGVDSKVLLHALFRLRQLGHISDLSAVHVNHGLQDIAHHWQQACQADCQRYQIELHSTDLSLSENNQSNLEEVAREGRYAFFKSVIKPGQWLLMAHHQDDQAETLLFRLLRGCGLNGAGAMPVKRPLGQGNLLRPLLNISRAEIEAYAQDNQLDWLEDPSNQSDRFSRNFLRHRILPELKQKWPAYARTLSRFSQVAAEQSKLLAEVAAEDLKSVVCQKVPLSTEILEATRLCQLSVLRQKNLLHYWGIQTLGLAPTSYEIEEVANQLEAAKKQSIKVQFAGQSLRSYNGQLMLTPKRQPQPIRDAVCWDKLDSPLTLPNGIKLTARKIRSGGLRKPSAEETVRVCPRQGGERCQPQYRNKSNGLKKIYQELKVPPWQREWLPVIYYNDEIVAVPGVFVVNKFVVEDEKDSIELKVST